MAGPTKFRVVVDVGPADERRVELLKWVLDRLVSVLREAPFPVVVTIVRQDENGRM